jgi:hypothetical protein
MRSALGVIQTVIFSSSTSTPYDTIVLYVDMYRITLHRDVILSVARCAMTVLLCGCVGCI